MKTFKVYLAGPITGLGWEGANDWRDWSKHRLADLSNGRIEGFSPLRSKDYLKSEGLIMDTYENTVLSSSRGIITRDRFDCMTSDLILVNMLGAEKVSIGTVMEIAWADAFRKPIVLAMEKAAVHINVSTGIAVPDGPSVQNIHEHAMIREVVGFRTDNLDQAIQTCVRVLLP